MNDVADYYDVENVEYPDDDDDAGDDMDTGGCPSPARAMGAGSKQWTASGQERDGAFYENGEYFPFAIDTTQDSYYATTDRDKLGVRYRGRANHHADWGGVRANHPLPKRRRMFYFEVTVVSAGQQASVTIGLVKSSFPMTKQPGIEPGSFGFEGSQGFVFNGSSRGSSIGSAFSTGDTVGLGVNLKKMEAFLTRNGQLLGTAFPGIRCGPDAAGLYPCVGLHSPGEAVRLNFGQRPFLFDLSASVAEEDSREQAAIDAVPVCPSLMRALVRDYLLHQGCEKTLRSLGQADGQPEDSWGGHLKAPTTSPPPSAAAATNGSAPLTVVDGKWASNGTAGGVSSTTTWAGRTGPDTGIHGSGASGFPGGANSDIHNSSNRSSGDDMDVDEEGGRSGGRAGGDVTRGGISVGTARGNEDEQEEEKRAEVDAVSDRRAGGAGAAGGAREAYESAAAGGDLLRQLQLHLESGQEVDDDWGDAELDEDPEEGEEEGEDDDGEYLEEEDEEDEDGEGDDIEAGDDHDPEAHGHEDREDEEEEDEEDDEDEEIGIDDVLNPWIPSEPFRRAVNRGLVRPLHARDLLAEGNPRAAVLAQTLSLRTRLRRDILEGNIDRATELLQAERPGLLEKRADVRFALKCQAFIELVKKGELTAAVALAQRDLSPFRDSGRVRFGSSWGQGGGGGNNNNSNNGMATRGGDIDSNSSPSPKNGFTGPPSSSSPSAREATPTLGGRSNVPSQHGLSTRAGRHGAGGVEGDSGARRGARRTMWGESRGTVEDGGREARSKGTRTANEGSDYEGDGGQPRTRKRRTRSYDDRRAFTEDSQASGLEWGAGGDNGGSGTGPTSSVRRGFPSTFCGIPSTYDSKLIAVMGLLAYKDPANSPLGHLVSSLQNQAIADKVNDAILAADALPRRGSGLASSLAETHAPPPVSGLELAVRHLLATRQVSREAAGHRGPADMRHLF